eukprot:GHVU01038602.1.p1 GENE.GHVU01038602.1~~GHVU01038602.1.p1  ORF type:complete len:101 (-),score=9.00 GHVU01038602.1:16-318(-)
MDKEHHPTMQVIDRGTAVIEDDLRKYVIKKFEGRYDPHMSIWWLNPMKQWVELLKEDFPYRGIFVDRGSIKLVILGTSDCKPNLGRTGEDVVRRCVIFLV